MTKSVRADIPCMRSRVLVAVTGGLMVISGCSVSTPRNGFTAAGGANAAGQPGADGTVNSGGGTGGAAPGGTATSGATGSLAGGSAAGGSAGGTVHGSLPPSGGAGGTSGGSGSGTTSDGAKEVAQSTSAVGVTKASITVTFMAGFSGTYGTPFKTAYDEGFDTWLQDVNARGGIYGRKVIVKQVDHKETADGGVGACRETLGNGTFMAFIGEGQGEGNQTAANCLDKAGFTNIAFANSFPSSWHHTFGFVASNQAAGKSLGTFVKNKMGDGAAKLGIIHLSTPSHIEATTAYTQEAKALGMKIVDSEQVDPNQSSFTSQLLRLKNAGAMNVAMIVGPEVISIWRDAASINYHPHWTGYGWAFDLFTQAARNTADGAEGLALSSTSDNPAFARWKAKAAKYGKNTKLGTASEFLYGDGQLLEEALRKAGPNPTRASLEASLETIKGYDNEILPPITYGPGSHVGTIASWPVICCQSDYTLKALGPAQSTF